MSRSLTNTITLITLVMTLSVVGTACQHELRPIEYGEDNGAFCRMTIVNPRFAGAILTDKGRTLKFDALECMANFTIQEEASGTTFTTDRVFASVNENGDLLPVADLYFVISDSIRTPMGGGVIAYQSEAPNVLSWEDVLEQYRRPGEAQMHH